MTFDLPPAHEQIRNALARYCRGVDRCDEQVVLSAFHSDATDDHGAGLFVGSAADFASAVVQRHRRAIATQHVISSPEIDVQGSVAHVETYCTTYIVRTATNGQVIDTVGGRYIDRFEERLGIWLIAHRTWIFDWGTVTPIHEPFPSQELNVGQRLTS